MEYSQDQTGEYSQDQTGDNSRGFALLLSFVLVAVLAFVSGMAFGADKGARVDRADLRIQDMHTKLKITTAQEEQWGKVAEVMRDNAKVMDSLTQTRMDHSKSMTAVDDLKSYGEIAAAHAEGIRKLTPVFADLYASMSEAQRLEADTLFLHGPRKPGNRRSAPRASASQ